jgi:hypothetical protein
LILRLVPAAAEAGVSCRHCLRLRRVGFITLATTRSSIRWDGALNLKRTNKILGGESLDVDMRKPTEKSSFGSGGAL